MRILLVSGFFPPFAPMAGVRASKLAKYLIATGHDVRVLAARDLPYPPVLPLEIRREAVVYSRWVDVNALPKLAASAWRQKGISEGGGQKPSAERSASAGASGESWTQRLFRRMRDAYIEWTNWPDPQIGWVPFAVRDGNALLSQWQADVIYASAPPLSGLLVAARLARRHRIPWIAEFRDLWIDHPYYEAPALRRALERLQERRVVATACALVTVSDVWAALLRDRFGKPTETILNGFDPEDYPEDAAEPSAGPGELTLLYTGSLYVGRRDPTPVFEAIRMLGEDGRGVRVDFYGADETAVRGMAERTGVAEQVRVHPPVPYAQVVELQRAADILLLLRWDDPTERGVVPGKLFEYIAARRPILSLGYDEGTVPEIIRSRNAGINSNSPSIIAARLQEWIRQKRATGRVEPLPSSARVGLGRPEQFEKLSAFIERVRTGVSP